MPSSHPAHRALSLFPNHPKTTHDNNMMLHDYLYGDGDDYDYDYDGFFVPSHEYYRLKRQEELRRRYELEQAYRREQQERYLRNLRRREEQMRRRRELEQLHDALAEQPLFENEDESKQPTQPKYQLVRGIDGLLYRVPIHRAETNDTQNLPLLRRPTVKEVKSPQIRSGESSNRLSHVPKPVVPRRNTKRADSNLATETRPDEASRERVVVNVRVPEEKEPKRGRNRRKVTVVVEDASDSEDENDELKSVWRNRRPSPGQWIEPVEF